MPVSLRLGDLTSGRAVPAAHVAVIHPLTVDQHLSWAVFCHSEPVVVEWFRLLDDQGLTTD